MRELEALADLDWPGTYPVTVAKTKSALCLWAALGTPKSMLLRKTLVALFVVVWTSSLLFGIYIVGFYGLSSLLGKPELWNKQLPELYSSDYRTATAGIGLHFIGGGLLLILGCLQILPWLRHHFPKLHRTFGVVYLVAAVLTALGGLLYIFAHGTLGGTVMDLGFGLYGILVLIAALGTAYSRSPGRESLHRRWALRLFTLAMGSWFYRMAYGFWFLITHKAGHNSSFTGPFDRLMAFAFYLPQLIILEWSFRISQTGQSKTRAVPSTQKDILLLVLLMGCLFYVIVATFYFTIKYWYPSLREIF